jgi:uncharacterized protein YjbI with pentapeptide repeats
MMRQHESFGAALRVAGIVLVAALPAFGASAENLACPANGLPPPGKDFHGQTIKRANFSYQDLTNANFAGATLIAPFFDYANLTNANFQGAVIENDNSNPALVADFSFANLEGACFPRRAI